MEQLMNIVVIALAGALGLVLRKYRQLKAKEKMIRREMTAVLRERDEIFTLSLDLCNEQYGPVMDVTMRDRIMKVVERYIDLVERNHLPAQALIEHLSPNLMLAALSDRLKESVHCISVSRFPHQIGLLILHAQQAPDPDAQAVKAKLGGVTVLVAVPRERKA